MFKEISQHQQSLFAGQTIASRGTLQLNSSVSYGLPVGPSNTQRDLTPRVGQGQFQQSSA